MKKILPILLALLLCASLVLPALAEERFSDYFSLCGVNVQRLYQTEKPVTITAGFAGTLQNYGLKCYHSVTVAENVSLSMREIRTSDGATLRINSGATVSTKEIFVGDCTNVIVYGNLILPEATGSWCWGTIEVCEGGMLKMPCNEENTANIEAGKVKGNIEIKTEGGNYIVTAPATGGTVLSEGALWIVIAVAAVAVAAVACLLVFKKKKKKAA